MKLTGQTACQPAATACAKGQFASSAAACASCGAGQSSSDSITYVGLFCNYCRTMSAM